MAPHPTLLAAVACVGVAFLLQFVGVATPNWLTAPSDLSGVSFNLGLWKYCTAGTCSSYIGDVADWLKATRAFGIIAILLMAASVGCGVLVILKPDQAMFRQIPPLLAVAGTFTSIVSFAVFAGKKLDLDLLSDSMDFGFSFFLCIVAAVLSGLSAALHQTSRRFQTY